MGSLLTGHAPTWGSAARKYLSAHSGPSALPLAMKQKGYRTGFFSASLDLDWDWTRWLLEDSLSFDTVSNCNATLASSRKLNSWACEEETAWESLLRFTREADAAGTPSFSVIFTTAPHFPYSVSQAFRQTELYRRTDFGRPVENPRHLDYMRALSYTDRNFGHTLDSMKENDLADRTLFAVIGDHGEAFGGRHLTNRLHRNNLYEENIRVSLLLAQPCFSAPHRARQVRDHRPASNIDVALTLIGATRGAASSEVGPAAAASGGAAAAGAAGSAAADSAGFQPGRDMLRTRQGGESKGSMVWFIKRSEPALAGVMDGDWKYITPVAPAADGDRGDGPRNYLFHLASDPLEARNLLAPSDGSRLEVAADLSAVYARARKYAKLVEMWFGMADCVYQEQFSSLTMHPFCRTVHIYRGLEGQLRGVRSVSISPSSPKHAPVLLLELAEDSVLDRSGLIIVAAMAAAGSVGSRTDFDPSAEGGHPSAPGRNQDFCPVGPPIAVNVHESHAQSWSHAAYLPFYVPAANTTVLVELPGRLASQQKLGVRVFDIRGGDFVVIGEEAVDV